MKQQQKNSKKSKTGISLHPRNKHKGKYDLDKLVAVLPELKSHVFVNDFGTRTIDFANAQSVMLLNKALLSQQYGISNWDIPQGYLCPPIPGRADYIHNVADLLRRSFFGNIPKGPKIIGLDVGVGANCIYPILGAVEYGWSFIGSDIDSVAVDSARNIVASNEQIAPLIECRKQESKKDFFYGILKKDEKVDFVVCNPPFHNTLKDAREANMRKVSNLSKTLTKRPSLNFGGLSSELVYEGGEERFVRNMVRQSIKFADNCMWFTSLVSKQSSMRGIYKILDELEVEEVDTILMGQGNKSSRIIAWSFMNKEEQKAWVQERWKQ